MKKCFITIYKQQWKSVTIELKNKLNYNIICLAEKEKPSIMSKRMLLLTELGRIFRLFFHLRKINHSNIIILSDYTILFLLLLRKFKILHCDKLIWFGMFIHNPKMISLTNKIFKIIAPHKDTFKIIVFSKSEKKLYSKKLGISETDFIYLPYGDWNPNEESIVYQNIQEKYYFAGGYSNRDYISLVQNFPKDQEQLIIAASKQNSDFFHFCNQNRLNKNIKVFWDITAEEFNRLLVNSYAVIFIMRHNTGASGQMVVLSAMRNRKLVITTYTDVMCEYIENEKTGIVIKHAEELPRIIAKLSEGTISDATLKKQALTHYMKNYSYQAISKELIKQLALQE